MSERPCVGAVNFLSRFEAILFDLNGTLAEGFDRFDATQDYHATYRRLGGRGLEPAMICRIIEDSLERCLRRYERGPWDPFPSFVEFLDLDDPGESRLVLDTVAEHELGVIPTARLEWLRRLGATHRLGLVSNLWAPGRRLRAYLTATGLDETLDTAVLSSEEGAVKPSRRLFETALDRLGRPASRVLFVGDDYRRDIQGAAACGLHTVWISSCTEVPGEVLPDRIAADVETLARLD